MILCSYGCGREARFHLSNGKDCCEKHQNSCPANKLKNSKSRRLQNSKKKKCPICGRLITAFGINFDVHFEKCKQKEFIEKIDILQTDVNNKYLKVYNTIIQNRSKNPIIKGYGERHHILPRSLGGSNDKSNLIKLSAREHFICHLLLIKIYKNEPYKQLKMYQAFLRLSTKENQKLHSRLYKHFKEQYAIKIKGRDLSKRKGKIWVCKDGKNKIISKEELTLYLEKGWIHGRIVDCSNIYNHKNTIWICNKDNESKHLPKEDAEQYLQNGWKLGRNFNKKTSVNTINKRLYLVNKDGIVVKCNKQLRDKYLSEGWKKGKYIKHGYTTIKNLKLMNNGKEQRFVEKTEIENYIKLGWILGGIKGLKAGKSKSFRTKEHREKLRQSNLGKHMKKGE